MNPDTILVAILLVVNLGLAVGYFLRERRRDRALREHAARLVARQEAQRRSQP